MSHSDNTPDQSGTGAGGSSSSGRHDPPEYGQRVEGAPSGPSYEPRSGQGGAGDPYATPQYGQGQQGYQSQYNQGQYDQGQYGGQGYQGQDTYGQGQQGYQDQYRQGQYDQGQYGGQGYQGQGRYDQGQYGGQGQQGYQGQYDMNQYGASPRPAGTGLGIASLVLGIVALLTCWFVLGLVPGLVGLVLGIVALRKLGRTPGASKALPIIGIVLSVLAILASILFLVLFGALFGEFGPAMEACSQYSSDQAAFQQCIEREMGFTGQDL
ncbi:DUF4190 domain-containing protein [Kocuria rosea]|uniref:DUF4190 domain-containing protein n=1 Tax=Kocuria rosea TaxID=1275 RepID=UPI00253FD3CF|nr:DUF4190 domain-containing protein [Kocuria rosea]WIG18513.1 DUF4190 domain-containing protein [Kocuria rosea]